MNAIKNKRTITLEDLESGGVRVTVAGTPFLYSPSVGRTMNLSTHDIPHVYLSDFAAAAGEDRAAYSAKHCTDDGMLHGPNGCDGMCHDLNCDRPADLFECSKGENGLKHCIPFCKFHGHGMCHRVGRAVLMALDFGVIEDLRFWTQVDPLPSGLPRCHYHYYATDEWGDSERARCTEPATKRVRVIVTGGAGSRTIDTELCADCASTQNRDGVKIDVLGDLPMPPVNRNKE
ncbi:MAG TPA: hypothetical protein VMS18_13270 [Candidatus Binatia bacterium]|nr:hypothetical protein [Candidatus Binatia bacterium]